MSPKRILLVEDDKDVRECLRILLNTVGYEVDEAEHGLSALGRLEAGKDPPQGIILDIMMPVMNGNEFLRELRSRFPHLAEVPVIVLSARENSTEILADFPGIKARVAKPFVITELISTMEKLF